MYLLIEKSTNIVRDIQSQPFAVTSDFEWIEDKSITERTTVGWTYNKDSKEFVAPPLAPSRPSELPNSILTEKIAELEARLEQVDSKEPRLGVAHDSLSPVWYVGILFIVFGGLLFFAYATKIRR